MSWSEQREEKAQVKQYLEEKYGEEFTAEKSYFYTAFLGSSTVTRTESYPNDNPKIKVMVTKRSDRGLR
jgi:hypothetical protein